MTIISFLEPMKEKIIDPLPFLLNHFEKHILFYSSNTICLGTYHLMISYSKPAFPI